MCYRKKRESDPMISCHSFWPLLELFDRFYLGKIVSQYQLVCTFHCTYKYYAYVRVVSINFCHIHTPSNTVIDHPPFLYSIKIAHVCIYQQGGSKMTNTTRYEGKLLPWTGHLPVSAELTEILNLKFDIKDTMNWYFLH